MHTDARWRIERQSRKSLDADRAPPFLASMGLASPYIKPTVTVRRVGRAEEPVVVIDGFAPTPDALRAAALAERFGPAAHHYPGVRAPLPPTYFQPAGDLLATILSEVFGHHGRVDVLDASFSVVCTPPGDLSQRQRLPHCDAFAPGRIALVHYLAPGGGDGTAFFRHRATGFETIDENRAPGYFKVLEEELRSENAPAPGYIAGDTALFERTALIKARYNRALLYRSFALHSGAIAPDARLSSDPATGRLTVTAFLSAS